MIAEQEIDRLKIKDLIAKQASRGLTAREMAEYHRLIARQASRMRQAYKLLPRRPRGA